MAITVVMVARTARVEVEPRRQKHDRFSPMSEERSRPWFLREANEMRACSDIPGTSMSRGRWVIPRGPLVSMGLEY